ncbi:MAG TPA: methyl-accepting chemotaxis protein, partial [Planctomycetota bacterium]|nr:methyl-accepting chemotaxis protein [Planctomycetota bacterium]
MGFRFRDLTVGRKIAAQAGVLTAAGVLISVVCLAVIRDLSEDVTALGRVRMPAMRAAATVDMAHDGLRSVAYGAIMAADVNDAAAVKRFAEEHESFAASFRHHLDKIAALDLPKDVRTAVQQVRPRAEAYFRAAGAIVAGARVDAATGRAELPGFDKSFRELETDLARLTELIERCSGGLVDEAQARAATNRAVALCATLVALGVGLFTAWRIARRVGDALRSMVDALRDFDGARELATTSKDEIGEMASLINRNVGRLRATMREMERITAMVEDAPTPTMFVGVDGRISWQNRAGHEAFAALPREGRPAGDEAVGAPFAELTADPVETRRRLASPATLPCSLSGTFGAETVRFDLVAVKGADGACAGAMVTWRVTTQEDAERLRAAEAGADKHLVDALLEGAGAADSVDAVASAFTRALREAYGFATVAWWARGQGASWRRRFEEGATLGGADEESGDGLVPSAAFGDQV